MQIKNKNPVKLNKYKDLSTDTGKVVIPDTVLISINHHVSYLNESISFLFIFYFYLPLILKTTWIANLKKEGDFFVHVLREILHTLR